MSKRKFRIRLSGLEVTCPQGELVLAPWHLISQRSNFLHFEAARRIWPQLPRCIGVGQLQARVIGGLRDRCTRRRFETGKLDLFWRAPGIAIETLLLSGVALQLLLVLGVLLSRVPMHPTRVEAAIHANLSIGFWCVLALLVLLVGGVLLVCLIKLARIAWRNFTRPHPVALRATSRGLTVTTDDGKEATYSWARITRFDDGAFGLDDGTRIQAEWGNTAPAELACLRHLLEQRQRTLRRRTDDTPLAQLRPVISIFGKVWPIWCVFAIAAGMAADFEWLQIAMLIVWSLLIPVSIVGLVSLDRWIDGVSRRSIHRARVRRRRAR